MVTFAQAQERAEEWINGDVVAYQHREVRVREFELGFVVWAEDRAGGPRSDGGAQRLVIARDSGEATLWPSLPVGEVIRRYEEEYGVPDAAPETAAPAPPARVDLNQTSFLLSPPEWLQEAADKLGIPDRRGGCVGLRTGRGLVLRRYGCGFGLGFGFGCELGCGWGRPARLPGAECRTGPLGPGRTRRPPADAPPVDAPAAHFVPGAPSAPVGVRRGPRPVALRTRGRRACPPTRPPGRGPTPTRTPATTVPSRCRRPCSRRR